MAVNYVMSNKVPFITLEPPTTKSCVIINVGNALILTKYTGLTRIKTSTPETVQVTESEMMKSLMVLQDGWVNHYFSNAAFILHRLYPQTRFPSNAIVTHLKVNLSAVIIDIGK